MRRSLLRCGTFYSVGRTTTALQACLQRCKFACRRRVFPPPYGCPLLVCGGYFRRILWTSSAVRLASAVRRPPSAVRCPTVVRLSSVFWLVPVSCSVVALSPNGFLGGIAKTRGCFRCLWNASIFWSVPTFFDALFFWNFPFVWEVPFFLERFRKYIRTNFYPVLGFSKDADPRLMSGNPP